MTVIKMVHTIIMSFPTNLHANKSYLMEIDALPPRLHRHPPPPNSQS